MSTRQQLELFTADDARYVATILATAGVWELRWRKDVSEVFNATVVESIEQLDLEALVTSTHGVVDPIGQLKQWLYDRLKELADWFAQTVEDIVRRIWETVAKPFLDTIKSVVDNIWSFLQQVPGTVENALDWLSRQISGVWSWIQEDIIDPLFNAISNLIDRLKEGISMLKTFFTETIPQLIDEVKNSISSISQLINDYIVTPLTNALSDLVATIQQAMDTLKSSITQIPSMIENVVSEIAKQIQQNIISPLANALNKLVETIEGGLQAISSFFTEQLPSLIDKSIDSIRKAFSDIVAILQQKVVTPLTDALKDLVDLISSGIQTITEFLTKELPKYINDIVDRIKGAFSEIKDALSSISKSIEGITSVVSGVVDHLKNALANLWNSIQEKMISPLCDALKNLIELMAQGIDTVKGFFNDVLPSMIEGIKNSISDLVSKIRDNFSKLTDMVTKGIEEISKGFSSIQKMVSELVDSLRNSFDKLLKLVTEGLQTVSRFLTDQLPSIMNQTISSIKDALRGVVSWIQQNVVKPLVEAFNTLVGLIDSGLQAVSKFLTEELPRSIDQAISSIRGAFEDIRRRLTEVFSQVIQQVKGGLQTISEFFTKQLPSMIENVVKEVARIPRVVFEATKEVGMSIWDYITKLGQLVTEGFEKLGEALTKVSQYLYLVGAHLTGFVNAVAQLPSRLAETLGRPIVDVLGSIRDKLSSIVEALEGVGKGLATAVSVLTDPGKIIRTVTDAFSGAVSWLAQQLLKIGSAIIDALAGLGSLIVGGVSRFAELASSMVRSMATAVSSALQLLFTKLVERASPSPLDELAKPFVWFAENVLQPIMKRMMDGISGALENPVKFMYYLLNFGTLLSVSAVSIKMLIDPIIESLPLVELIGSPMGAGGRLRFYLSRVFRAVSDAVEKALPDVARYIMIGHMIWWAEPTRAITRQWLTEWVTVELPPLEHGIEAVRRRITTPVLGDYYRMFTAQLRMGGIYKGFIDALYSVPEKLVKRMYEQLGDVAKLYDRDAMAVVIRDRFGKERYLPTSLVYALPTPSELARMMIRDIIQHPIYFATAMAMHGFTPDVAFMFYLLHYRYPPPEKLADFFWRGIAGELWNPEAPVDTGLLATFGIDPTTWRAVAPKELNFNYDVLKDMISTYMKWHDYARFPWQPGWTTDNAIIIELMADIPTKIDLRWMTRWGLFDYWSAHGVGLKTAIHEITKRLIPDRSTCPARPMIDKYLEYLRTGEIVFDLKQFCRVLQATGIHPYWIPWVAIAESINALTEERTLLRTGFINLYKEGIWSLDRLNELLSGFFTVKFEVGYFDPEKKDWAQAVVEYPVAFLPAESKLLELRAAMDRALDIYREAYRAVIGAVRSYVLTPDEAKQRLGAIVDEINKKFFSATIKAISGRELSLVLDEGYFGAWTEYAKLLADVEARERTRFYARYLLWSVLWGLRWGYTTEKEAEKWVNDLVSVMHEHEYVRQAIWLAVDFMVQRFFKEIKVRAIINLLRSRRISMEEAVKELTKLGFRKEQAIDYINANVVWYTPGLTTYATLLEIVPEAVNMSLRAIEHFNLPSDELQYWMIYVARKPIQDELTLLRTRIYNALASGMTVEEVVAVLRSYSMTFRFERGELRIEGAEKARKLLEFYEANKDVFQSFGIAPHEWVLYNVIAELERRIDELRRMSRERIPSPSTLAVLAEYIELPEDMVRSALERYGVAREWIGIWMRYIRVKPIKSDAKSLLSVYIRALRYGAVTKDEVEKFIEELVSYGFTSTEIELIRKRIELEERIDEIRELRRAYLPTPYMLATLSEYIRIPEDLIEKTLAARRVPSEWVDLWKKYISVRPLADDVRRLMTAYRRARVYGVDLKQIVLEEKGGVRVTLEDKIKQLAQEVGWTDREFEILDLVVMLEEKISEIREMRRQYLPTPMTLATLAEYLELPEDLVRKALEARHVPKEWVDIWMKYISVRPVKSDYRALLMVALRAYRYGIIDKRKWEEYLDKAAQYGFTKKEIEILKERASLELDIEEARVYLPTPQTLAILSEYIVLPTDLVKKALEIRRVPKEWMDIWLRYIEVRPLKSDYKAVLNAAARALRYGAISKDEWEKLLKDAESYGFTPKEIELIEKRVHYELLIESAREYVPTLGTIATMVEYVEVPKDVIDRVLKLRRVPSDFAELWLRYIEARAISREVNMLVAEFRRIYEYFNVSQNLVNRVVSWMRLGGWTSRELEVFWLALELRKEYRVLSWLIPTIRQLIADARYIPEWEQVLNDVLRIRGVDIAKYQKQIEYYKKLARNRIVWRQIAWYRNRLVYAYAYGVIDRATLVQKLQALKKYGLTDDEINLIVDAAEMERQRIQMMRFR